MNKNEFLSQLRKKLDVLSQDEIDELITEYSEHIDNKLHEGKTEEQAVSDFGDLGELSRNILQAYKLNENFTNKPKLSSFLNMSETTGKKLLSSFEQFYAKISLSEVFKFLILVILSFGLVAILKFPFMLFKSISLWFMEIIFGYKFVDYVDGIWSFVVNGAYYLSSILLIISVVHFGQQRYLQITHQSQSFKKKSVKTNDEDVVIQDVNDELTEETEVKVEEVIRKDSPNVKPIKQRNGFSNFIHQTVNLFYLCILWSLRLLILAVLFPMVIALIFGLFIWGMLVFLVITQVPIIGLTFTTGMGLIFAGCIIIVIFAYTFNIKLKTWRYSRIFTVITITLILGGFGSIWSLNEISQFEWVNEDVSEYKEYEYNLSDFEKIDMTNTWVSIEIDNALEDQVIISISPEIKNDVVSKVDQTLFITLDSYSEVEEINTFRRSIVEQFDALKEGKLVFQHNIDSNQVIIRVNEKNLQLVENRLEHY